MSKPRPPAFEIGQIVDELKIIDITEHKQIASWHRTYKSWHYITKCTTCGNTKEVSQFRLIDKSARNKCYVCVGKPEPKPKKRPAVFVQRMKHWPVPASVMERIHG